jgi:hypothetical protein
LPDAFDQNGLLSFEHGFDNLNLRDREFASCAHPIAALIQRDPIQPNPTS